jgi:two-component system cell cycle sensor histidine kinase/response regulator CckA
MRAYHVLAALLVVAVVGFIAANELSARREAQTAIQAHARVIAQAMWSLDSDSPRDYLELAIRSGQYESLGVTTTENERFFAGTGTPLEGPIDRALGAIGVIPHLPLRASVMHDGRVIGRIEAVARIRAVYGDFYAIVLGTTIFFAGRLYRRVVQANRELESRVAERTRTLRESETLFRALVENIGDAVMVTDANGTVLFDSDTGGRVLGFPSQEPVGLTLSELVHPDFRADFVRQFDAALAHPGVLVVLAEMQFRHRNGEWVWLEGSAVNHIGNGAVRGVIVSLRDVTPQHATRQALQRSEDRRRERDALLRAAFMTASDAYAIIERDTGQILEVNDRLLKVFGFSREECVGHTSSDLGMWFDTAQREAMVSRLKQQGEVQEFQLDARRKNGDTFRAVYSITPLEVEGRSPLYLSTMQDISEKVSLEAQLRQSQKLEAIGVLAGGVAHDFNNLLAVIVSYAELLLRDPSASEVQRADLEEIRNAADRAAELTRQLLAFSRRQAMQPRVIDVNNVLTGIARMLRRLIGEDIQLRTIPCERGAPAFVDKGQLEQVLVNLTVNARDAMPGGGTLTVSVSRTELDEATAGILQLNRGPHVLVNVHDTGAGMDAATLARIFEPFFTTKEVGKGTGLGLATVFGIVRQSGGAIVAESELGKGTTFRIWLPLAAADAVEASVANAESSSGASDRGTVLVVEDDEQVRRLVATILSARGFKVLEAASGGDALILWEKHKGAIDGVLTDVVMPLMRGDELVRRLRQSEPGLPVVFMSGYDDNAQHAAALPALAVFLAKPFTPDSLLARVREALGTGRGSEKRQPEKSGAE